MSGPVLTTERLTLRLPREGDWRRMAEIVAHPATGRYLGGAEHLADRFNRFIRNAGSWQIYGYGAFMICLKDTDTLIGNCGVFRSYRGLGPQFDDRAEAGWIVAAEHVGKGLAHEAMTAVLAWFDRTHALPVFCMIAPQNAPSIRLAGKLGFTPAGSAELPDGDAVRLFERPSRFA